MPDVATLESRLLGAIAHPDPGRFGSLALEVFAYQYAHNAPYRRFCDRRGLTPSRIDQWRNIPAVPTSAFKVAELTCRAGGPSGALFLTSGTTQGQDKRGRHVVADLALLHAAVISSAQTCLFPDLPASGNRRLLILSLTPPPSLRPHSSLIHMIDLLMRRWGAADSRFLGGSAGVNGTVIRQALQHAAIDHRPVALFGTTAAFAEWFNECETSGWAVTLPPNSRLMDTGGRKGVDGRAAPSLQTVVDRDAFAASCWHLLGLPPHAVVNEYGMTELSSQFYDDGLASVTAGTPPPGQKIIPPWVGVSVIDPVSGEEAPDGAIGLLRYYDLANFHSVMAVQTDDIGLKRPGPTGGFDLMGRAAGSEPRGCSLDPSSALLTR
jgi:hypothetical protein